MSKEVVLNGIEILTNESGSSVQSLLAIVECVIDHLESDLDRVDENFNLSINMDFSPTHPPIHSFSLTILPDNGTGKKAMWMLEESASCGENDAPGV